VPPETIWSFDFSYWAPKLMYGFSNVSSPITRVPSSRPSDTRRGHAEAVGRRPMMIGIMGSGRSVPRTLEGELVC
jgi:hypothetical protein